MTWEHAAIKALRQKIASTVCPRDECTLMRNVQMNPKATTKGLIKMLSEAWMKMSEGQLSEEKPTIKEPDFSLQMQIRTKILFFVDMSCGLLRVKMICLIVASRCGAALFQEHLLYFPKQAASYVKQIM